MPAVRELDDLVKEYFQDLKEEDGFYTGFINGKDAFETFFIHLRASGYWFVTKHSTHFPGTAGDHAKKGVFFQNMRKGSNVQIPFFGALFEHVKNSYYECSQGKKRHQDLKKGRTLPPGKKSRVRVRISKKIGCSASMTVWQIAVFPEYTIGNYNAHGTEQQTKLARQLKAHIATGNETGAPPGSQPVRNDRFVMRISTASVHNHPTLSCAMTQTLHPQLSAEIGSLVKKNICTVREIELHLTAFVERKVEESVWPASERPNSCFYPNRSVIYNHIQKAIFELKEKKLDQDEFGHYVTNCIPPCDNIFFRPYREMRKERNHTCDVTSLLVCHQTMWQKHLLHRYGNCICVLDSYKKTGNNMNLFFLVVKTNVGYSIAGLFIVQSISSEFVEEALRVFLSWNSDWYPLYFMTDFATAEMSAIQNTFPESTMYLCAYYRERAWNHWLGHRDNGLPADTQIAFMRHWKEIASSKTVVELEENIVIMKNSDEYKQHFKVRNYMEQEWLPDVQHWVDAFHSEDFLMKLKMMNGVDSQSKELNHTFLEQNSEKTLSELMHLVLTDYLPIVSTAYQRAQLLTEHEPPPEDCPEFLKDRPIHFVKHVMQRYSAAKVEYTVIDIIPITHSRFAVADGELKNTLYFVDFHVPSCTCSDFAKWQFPCTHLCAIFLHEQDKTFESLPKSYLNSPYLTVDEELHLFKDYSELVPMYDNTVTIAEIDRSEISDCVDAETIVMAPVKLEIEAINDHLQLEDNSELVPMHNNTVTIAEMDQIDISDCVDDETIVMTPVKLGIKAIGKNLQLEDNSELVPMHNNTVTIAEMDQIDISDCVDDETIVMTPVKLEIKAIGKNLQSEDSSELVPMHNNTVTIEMDQIDISDCVDDETIVMTPVKLEIEAIDKNLQSEDSSELVPKHNNTVTIEMDQIDISDCVDDETIVMTPVKLEIEAIDKNLQLEDSSELVPKHNNTVTIEMDRNDASDCVDDETIAMTPVKLEIEAIDEAAQIREMLKDMYQQTFLVEHDEQRLGKTKSKLLAAKLLLAEGRPRYSAEPPPLTRIVKNTDNHTNNQRIQKTNAVPPLLIRIDAVPTNSWIALPSKQSKMIRKSTKTK